MQEASCSAVTCSRPHALAPARCSINVTRDDKMKELAEALGEQVEEQMDDDDEVIIAGGEANTKCPITQKNVSGAA